MIPKVVERISESRAVAVEPRDLVEKDHSLARTAHFFQIDPQLSEGLAPTGRHRLFLLAAACQLFVEIAQLVVELPLANSGQFKAEMLLKVLSDQVGLAHSPPAIDRDELRRITLQELVQGFAFFDTTDERHKLLVAKSG